MNILSLFDGISCGQVALQKAAIPYKKYIASEIDQRAIKITQKNFPKTIQFGDVRYIKAEHFLEPIDLIIAGSPCQGFSFAGKQLNFNDPRSKLFFEFIRLKNELSPKYFFLENVRMKKESEDVITKFMEVEPIYFDSYKISAQHRKRIYWTNIHNSLPKKDIGISFQDIKQNCDCVNNYRVKPTPSRLLMWGDGLTGKCKNITSAIKTPCLTVKQDRWANGGLIENGDFCRFLTPIECERLQGLPDGYTKYIPNEARYHSIGNGWQVDTIVEFFKHLPSHQPEC